MFVLRGGNSERNSLGRFGWLKCFGGGGDGIKVLLLTWFLLFCWCFLYSSLPPSCMFHIPLSSSLFIPILYIFFLFNTTYFHSFLFYSFFPALNSNDSLSSSLCNPLHLSPLFPPCLSFAFPPLFVSFCFTSSAPFFHHPLATSHLLLFLHPFSPSLALLPSLSPSSSLLCFPIPLPSFHRLPPLLSLCLLPCSLVFRQSKVLVSVSVSSPDLFHVVLRYANRRGSDVRGRVSVIDDSWNYYCGNCEWEEKKRQECISLLFHPSLQMQCSKCSIESCTTSLPLIYLFPCFPLDFSCVSKICLTVRFQVRIPSETHHHLGNVTNFEMSIEQFVQQTIIVISQ